MSQCWIGDDFDVGSVRLVMIVMSAVLDWRWLCCRQCWIGDDCDVGSVGLVMTVTSVVLDWRWL